MSDHIEVETRAEDVLAEIAVSVGFGDGSFHDVEDVAVFSADINKTEMGADCAPRDDHAFDELVRIHLHQRAVFASAGLGFIGIANQVSRFRGILRNERPLHPGREARAATAAKAGFLHFVDDAFRRHLLQGFFNRLVATVL